MPGRVLRLLGIALALIALERLLNAMMLVSEVDNAALSIRLLIAFLCGGIGPVLFAFGYISKNEDR
jgi:hypothetical protein